MLSTSGGLDGPVRQRGPAVGKPQRACRTGEAFGSGGGTPRKADAVTGRHPDGTDAEGRVGLAADAGGVVEGVSILGGTVPIRERSSQLLFCVAGLFAAFVVQNFLQEYVFQIEGFEFGAFMAFFEFVICAGLAGLERTAAGVSPWTRTRTLAEYAMLSLVLPLSSATGTSALSHVNMPVKVVFKSSKLLPTMIAGVGINGTRYSAWDVVSAAALCAGVIGFTLADARVSPNFDTHGLVLLTAAVLLDAMIPNCQQRLMAEPNPAPKLEIMFFTNLFGTLIIGISLLATGEGASGVTFCASNPAAGLALVLYGITTYAGISFYVTTVKTFGAVTAITATTLRKILTLMLSFVYFQHQWSALHVVAGAAVLGLGCIKIKGETPGPTPPHHGGKRKAD